MNLLLGIQEPQHARQPRLRPRYCLPELQVSSPPTIVTQPRLLPGLYNTEAALMMTPFTKGILPHSQIALTYSVLRQTVEALSLCIRNESEKRC